MAWDVDYWLSMIEHHRALNQWGYLRGGAKVLHPRMQCAGLWDITSLQGVLSSMQHVGALHTHRRRDGWNPWHTSKRLSSVVRVWRLWESSARMNNCPEELPSPTEHLRLLLVGLLHLTIGLGVVPRGQAAAGFDQLAESLSEPGSELGPSVEGDVLGEPMQAYTMCSRLNAVVVHAEGRPKRASRWTVWKKLLVMVKMVPLPSNAGNPVVKSTAMYNQGR